MKITSIATALVGISIGLCIGGAASIASMGEVVYTDGDTGKIPPFQIPETYQPLYTVTRSVIATGTVSMTATGSGTGTWTVTGTQTGTGSGAVANTGTATGSMTGTGTISGTTWATSTFTGIRTLTLTGVGTGITTATYTGINVGASTAGDYFASDPKFSAATAARPYSFSIGETGAYSLSFNALGVAHSGAATYSSSGIVWGGTSSPAWNWTAPPYYASTLRFNFSTGKHIFSYSPNKIGNENPVMSDVASVSANGIESTKNTIDCQAPLQCNGASGTASLLQTATLTASVATGTNSSTVARGDDGASAHTLSAAGGLAFRTDATTATVATVSLAQNATLTMTNTSTATATATVTNTISVSTGLNLTVGTNTVTTTTAQIDQNPKVNLSAVINCSGCGLSGTGTGTATSKAISESPTVVVTPASVGAPPTSRTVCGHPLSADVTCTPADVGALPSTNVSVVTNYLAKGGASSAEIVTSNVHEVSGRIGVGTTADANVMAQISANNTYPKLYLGEVAPWLMFGNASTYPSSTVSAWIAMSTTTGHFDGTSAIGDMHLSAPTGMRFRTGAGWLLSELNGSGDFVAYRNLSGISTILRGVTSGSKAIKVPAVAGSGDWTLPAGQATSGQSIRFSDASGTMEYYTPLASTGVNYTGCTTTSSTGGLVTACDTTARVPESRTVTCGNGLSQTGGPALSSNVTCYVSNTDGSINVGADTLSIDHLVNDTQHGNRGGGSLHSVATSVNPGFMPSTDKAKLDGMSGMSTTTPLAPGFSTPSYGSSTYAARADHRHSDVIDLVYAGANNQYFSPPIIYAGSPTIILELPVYWLNMPSSLAVWATWTYENRGPATTCYLSLYTGSDVRGTLGGTTMFPYTTTSVPVGNSYYMENTAYNFTKPTNGSNGTRSRVQVYTYCASGSTVVLNDMHIHITGVN